MPQLDTTMNLVWYLCSVFGIGVLYLQNVYVYMPFFVRYWKFSNYYIVYSTLVAINIYREYLVLLQMEDYVVSNCMKISYSLDTGVDDLSLVSYSLDPDWGFRSSSTLCEYCDCAAN